MFRMRRIKAICSLAQPMGESQRGIQSRLSLASEEEAGPALCEEVAHDREEMAHGWCWSKVHQGCLDRRDRGGSEAYTLWEGQETVTRTCAGLIWRVVSCPMPNHDFLLHIDFDIDRI